MKQLPKTEKLRQVYNANRIYCKCSHSVIIPKYLNKVICDWCGRFVFRTKKCEYDYRMKEQLAKTNK